MPTEGNIPRKYDPSEAERLKNLGNELYKQEEYDAAHSKYTEAIAKNPTNAIIYANRAAVLLATKDYLEAASDCAKAIELDPTYAKAWGRLGKATYAMSEWEQSIHAWEEALKCLPVENLTPDQQLMKEQFAKGLSSARANRKKVETLIETIPTRLSIGKFPWDIANTLKLRKLAAAKPSCVVVVIDAHGDFVEAMQTLAEQRLMTHPQTGEPSIAGNPNVLQPLVNAILTDERVFHITEPDFVEKAERQCTAQILKAFESKCLTIGVDKASSRVICYMAGTQPWDRVRPAISATVRTWIFRAFLHWQLLGKHVFAHELLSQALKFLEWGRKQWASVPVSDRGVVFETSWIRGVKRLHLSLMHTAKAHKGQDSPFDYEDLMAAAKDLVEDVDSNPPDPSLNNMYHLGHLYAYWLYPKAQAMSVLGWSYMQVALRACEDDPLRSSIFKAASDHYLAAAEAYPTDDNFHPTLLRKHLECMCQMNKPLKVTLPLCDRILKVIPEALEIWAIGTSGEELRKTRELVRNFQTHWTTEIQEGKATMDDVGKIDMPTVPRLKAEKAGLTLKVESSYLGSDGDDKGEGSSRSK